MTSRLIVAAFVSLCAALWGFLIWRSHGKRPATPAAEQTLRVTFLNVGYGDAAWIRTPAGKNFLIDAGPGTLGKVREHGRSLVFSRDAGVFSLPDYLAGRGVTRLEAVVISHPHFDHWGGLEMLLKSGRISVSKVYESPWTITDSAYERFRDLLEENEIPRASLLAGNRVDMEEPDLSLIVLGPREPYDGTDSDVANRSLVLKLTKGGASVLFAGDVEEEAELDLLEAETALSSTVLKVPSHGARSSAGAPLLDWVRPAVAVVSVDSPNPFGTPHDETLQRFLERDIDYHRTDLEGHIVFRTDGKQWTIHAEH